MSYIPSHAMPHAYVHEDDSPETRRRTGPIAPTTALAIGGAVLGYLLFKALR